MEVAEVFLVMGRYRLAVDRRYTEALGFDTAQAGQPTVPESVCEEEPQLSPSPGLSTSRHSVKTSGRRGTAVVVVVELYA